MKTNDDVLGKVISQVTIFGKPQPKSWQDYREGALANYGGGHRSDGQLEAFQHGMETIFNLIEAEFPPAEQCKDAGLALEVLKGVLEKKEHQTQMWTKALTDWANSCPCMCAACDKMRTALIREEDV